MGVVFCGTREKEKVITTPILLFSFVFFSFEGQLDNFYFFIFGNLFTIHSGDTFYHEILRKFRKNLASIAIVLVDFDFFFLDE